MASTTYTKILYAGTYANYKVITTKQPDALYFCTDNGKLFRGEVDFTDSFVALAASALPQTGVPGKIYYETDTKKFKTWISTGYVEIGNPIDIVGDSTTHTLSNASSDEHVPSSKNVWLYGQAIKAEVIGGSDVVSNVTADATDAAKIVVTYGDDSTNSVTIPGVITGIIADATDSASFIVTDSADATSKVTLNGVVTTPTWNETQLKLTLPVVGGDAIEVNIPKDIFLESGSYDATNKQIVLVLNDSSSTEIRFSVNDLIPVYVAKDTTTVDMDVAFNSTTGQYDIAADVNISATTGNIITIVDDGLYVDGRPYATTTQLGDLEGSHNNLAAAALQWGTF